jgi:hypothetical protein
VSLQGQGCSLAVGGRAAVTSRRKMGACHTEINAFKQPVANISFV